MASMTETMIPSSMIILVNVTIQKSTVALTGSKLAVIPIVSRDLQARRDRWAQEALLALRVFQEAEAR